MEKTRYRRGSKKKNRKKIIRNDLLIICNIFRHFRRLWYSSQGKKAVIIIN